ncbi:cell wall hydrolase [Desulfovibrio sp. TomC]|uniref:cell wall hydrolase n=1 Tax=Desulfovibrio sp. TomC TaxID=1562888 RepID=UPI0005747829|nr:cell wall hydrolase [Desulfovibrio sp. TomC]KHK00777.1 Phage endolysin [Desulfovibrio sp. TomC]
MFHFGSRSLKALATCHPALQAVAHKAIAVTPVDFIVTEGFRGREAQEEAYANGFSKARWGKSPHNHEPSLALDVVPYPVDWDDVAKFKAIAAAFKQAAGELGVVLRWGGDFKSILDTPHFEIDAPANDKWTEAPAASLDNAVTASLGTRADLVGLADAELLARVIWGECRGINADEARAIAHVVVNRANTPCWWGKTVKECCLKAKQFSCLNEGDPNLAKILAGDFRDGSWSNCLAEAGDALAGVSPDPTGGAVCYHASAMDPYPSWAQEMIFTVPIGSHRFYRER